MISSILKIPGKEILKNFRSWQAYNREKKKDRKNKNNICGNICSRYKTMSLIHTWAILPYKISACYEMHVTSKQIKCQCSSLDFQAIIKHCIKMTSDHIGICFYIAEREQRRFFSCFRMIDSSKHN